MEKDQENPNKIQWSFTNILSLLVLIITSTYFFWISFVLTKTERVDNSNIQQITIVMITMITMILNYHYGNSRNSTIQQQQITEMQKTATTVAQNTASNLSNNLLLPTAEETGIKIDKAVKISELKAALDKLDPESEDAKRIVAELEQLEKLT